MIKNACFVKTQIYYLCRSLYAVQVKVVFYPNQTIKIMNFTHSWDIVDVYECVVRACVHSSEVKVHLKVLLSKKGLKKTKVEINKNHRRSLYIRIYIYHACIYAERSETEWNTEQKGKRKKKKTRNMDSRRVDNTSKNAEKNSVRRTQWKSDNEQAKKKKTLTVVSHIQSNNPTIQYEFRLQKRQIEDGKKRRPLIGEAQMLNLAKIVFIIFWFMENFWDML